MHTFGNTMCKHGVYKVRVEVHGWVGGFGKVTKVARSFVSTEVYTSVKQSTTANAVIIMHRVLGVTCHST